MEKNEKKSIKPISTYKHQQWYELIQDESVLKRNKRNLKQQTISRIMKTWCA